MYGVLGAIVVVTVFAATFAPFDNSPPRTVECRVSFLVAETQGIEFVIRDERLIKDLDEEPLRMSKPDPKPSRYIVLGRLKLIKDDGKEETIDLFKANGNYAKANKYYIADFSKLMEKMKESMDVTRKWVFGPAAERK